MLSLLVAVVAGALAGGAAWAARRLRPAERALPLALAAIVFLGGNAVGQARLHALRERRSEADRIDAELLAIPLYREMKVHEPALWESLRARVVSAARADAPPGAVAASAREPLAAVVEKYLPRASDASVVGFGRVILEQVSYLEAKDPGLAFRFLFPAKGAAIDLSVLPRPLRERELLATAELLRTGAANPVPPPRSPRARELLAGVSSRLPPDVARNLASAAAPDAPGVDRPGVVAACRAFYAEVLRLPEADAALLLRDLLGGSPPPPAGA